MRARTLLLAALLLAALAPPAGAQATVLNPGPVQLYLSAQQGTLPGVGSVETLVAVPPANTADIARNISAEGVAWYAVPGVQRETAIQGPVSGNVSFQLQGVSGLPVGVTLQNSVTFALQKLTTNGTLVTLGNVSRSFALTATPPVSNTTSVSWEMSPSNASLLAGETLALNVTASSTPALGQLVVVYDSVQNPSGFNLTLATVARGNLQLSAGIVSRDVAPGLSVVYSVSVRNLATDPDTVRIEATGTPTDWSVSTTPAGSTTISAGGAATVLVTVRAPAQVADGTRHTTDFRVTSGIGGSAPNLTLTSTARASSGTPGDTDGDGFSDLDERRYGSNPNDRTSTPDNTDSDGDGVSNKAEIDAGTDPFNPADFPGSGDQGGGGSQRPSRSIFGPTGDSFAASLGVNTATGDLVLIALVLLFLLIILAILWMLLGGYPVKVSLVQARATTEPGRSADFAIEVRSRVKRAQAVDLEVAELPTDWEARFNNPSISLQPKGAETVGLLVKPPDNWPAPSKRDFQVRARSRLKPGKFAKGVAKLLIQPRAAAPAPPAEEAVQEAEDAWAPLPEAAPAPLPPAPPAGAYAEPPVPAPAAFDVTIGDVRHDPPVPERGSEVTTTARLVNRGAAAERVRVVLVVNGKVRDEVGAELRPNEAAEAEFHWIAYLARNEVKVVVERAA